MATVSVGVGVACGGSDENKGTPTGPGGEIEAGTIDSGGNGSDSGGTTSEGGGQDGGGGNDAAPSGPRDPFAQQSKVTSDFPSTADFTSNPDGGVVTDKTTGLMWSYTAVGVANLPPDGGDGSPTTIAEARQQCATATIGGQTGWRLPTRIEFVSALSFDQEHPFVPTAFDSDSYDNLPIWVNADDTNREAYFEGHYNPKTLAKKLSTNWFSGQLICVKAPYAVTDHAQPVDPNRFAVSGGVLSDKVTGLEWFPKIDATSRLWNDATSYCANLTADAGAPSGGKAWRLPTIKEVASLWIESEKGIPAAFNATSDPTYVWTSTHYQPPPQLIANPGYFRIFFEKTNPAGDFYWDVNDFASTICVRDGS